MSKYLVLDNETIIDNIEEFKVQLTVQEQYCRELQIENKKLLMENAELRVQVQQKSKKKKKAKMKAKLLAREVESLRQRYENMVNPMFLSLVQQNIQNINNNSTPNNQTLPPPAPPPPPPKSQTPLQITNIEPNEESIMDKLMRELRSKAKVYDP